MPSLTDKLHDNAAGSALADTPAPGLAEPAAHLSASQAAGLDDPAMLTQCQVGPRDAEGRVPVGLGISGMYCAACALTIEHALARLPGVSQVQVQGATQRARLSLDTAQVRLSDLVRAVQAAGYQAWPDTAARALHERRQARRHLLWRWLVAAFCMMQVMMITTAQYVTEPGEIPLDTWNLMNWASWVMSLPVLFFSCGPFFKGAWAALKQGRIAMDTPVALGIVAMFGVSTGVTFGHQAWLGSDTYFDSLTMFVTFLLGGRWLEARSRDKVTQSLEWLSGRLPEAVERACTMVPPGQAAGLLVAAVETVPLSALRLGDQVRVPVGHAFPADGPLLLGQTEVDEALLTGESRAVVRGAGQSVVAGSLNLGAPVWMQVAHLGPDTRYQQIVGLVHQAMTEKPGWLGAADRFAAPFLWAVLALAALGALAWAWVDPSKSLWVAVSVLVVTCPCALSLAAPAALLSAAGALARQGVLVRHLAALETLATVRLMLLDKTGTLTEPQLRLDAVWHGGQVLPWSENAPPTWPGGDTTGEGALTALSAVASLASHSRHPLSQTLHQAIRVALGHAPGSGAEQVTQVAWHDVREHAGSGLEATDASGRRWRLGSANWVWQGVCPDATGQPWPQPSPWPAGRVWFAPLPREGELRQALPSELLGFSLDEKLRDSATPSLRDLRALGVDLAVLSGDQPERVAATVNALDLTPPLRVAAAGVSPEGKLAYLTQAQAPTGQAPGHRTAKAVALAVAVVGDGINDAPVLAQASVSFALDQGAPLAQSQADFIVLGGRLTGLADAVRISRRAVIVMRQNLIWAAAYNFVCIPLALAGYLPPWLAGLGMALSSLAVMLNALRLHRVNSGSQTAV